MSTDAQTEHADIHERIRRGDFAVKKEYPQAPKPPEMLNKRAGSLTVEEFGMFQSVKAEYEAAAKAWKDGVKAWREESQRLEAYFRESLLDEYGMDPKLPISHMLLGLAWERGHAYGLTEVVGQMDELHDIYREAIRMRDEAKK